MLHGTQGHARSFCFMVLLFKDFLVDQVPSTYYLLDIFVSLEAYIIGFFSSNTFYSSGFIYPVFDDYLHLFTNEIRLILEDSFEFNRYF